MNAPLNLHHTKQNLHDTLNLQFTPRNLQKENLNLTQITISETKTKLKLIKLDKEGSVIKEKMGICNIVNKLSQVRGSPTHSPHAINHLRSSSIYPTSESNISSELNTTNNTNKRNSSVSKHGKIFSNTQLKNQRKRKRSKESKQEDERPSIEKNGKRFMDAAIYNQEILQENPSESLTRSKSNAKTARIKSKQEEEKSKTNQIIIQTNPRLKTIENNNLISDKNLHKNLHNSLYNSLLCDNIIILIVMKKCIRKNRGKEDPLFRKSTKVSILNLLSIISELVLPVLQFCLFSASIK